MVTLFNDVMDVVYNQKERMDTEINRPDASSYESYGRIKDALERAQQEIKPLEKAIKEYWGEVVKKDNEIQAALLNEMERQAEYAAQAAICLASTIARAIIRLEREELTATQMDMDELPEVDEETGEVMDEC